MKYNILYLLATVLLAAAPGIAWAQQRTADKIFMQDGKAYEGKIAHYVQGEKLLLRQADSTLLELRDNEIRKIVQGTAHLGEAVEPTQAAAQAGDGDLHTKGLFNTTTFSFAIGNNSPDGLVLGAGVGNVTGYQFASWLGIGVGIGVDNYASSGETVFPLFGELRSYLPSKKQYGFYLSAAGGYGFAFKRESLDITKASGGPMFHPAFGIRIGTTEGLDLNIDLGFKYQEASYTRNLFNNDTQTRNLTYQRVVLRAGMTLWN